MVKGNYKSRALLALLALSCSSVEAFAPSRTTMVPTVMVPSAMTSSSAGFLNNYSSTYSSSKLQMTSSSAAAVQPPDEDGKASSTSDGAPMTGMIFNLVKSIVGAGVLSLPAGISAFGNAPSAMIPAAILITAIGGLSGYGFSLIGRICALTNSNSYTEAWANSVGKETSIIPAASCTFKTTCAITAYSMILTDTFRAILSTAGINLSRTNTLLSLTSFILLPLCWLKDLSSLAPFSLLGIVGMGFTAVAMGMRYFTGAYAAPAGVFLPDIAAKLQPAFGNIGAAGVFTPNAFILICMLSTAYMSHFNAPKFYNELENNTVKRFNILVGSSFAISIATFVIMAGFGFLTFGAASDGLILNNYSNKDVLMGLSRVAVFISLVFSYPLAFAGCRDGAMDLMKVPSEKRTNGLLNKLTVGILAGVTGIAATVTDVSFILSFAGATLGNALIYVYPALMFRAVVKKMGNKATKAQKSEVAFAMANAGLGIGMGTIGAKMALKALG